MNDGMNKVAARRGLCIAMTVVMMFAAIGVRAEDKPYDPRKWEETIQKFEAMDEKNPPPKDGVLFIGSSSIRMWDLKKSFPDLKAINRGFGGSHIEDSTYYADRIIWPYKPHTIVLYAGDNDIAFGKSPERVVADFKSFVARVREKLPETRVVYIPIKPSLARWNLWPKMNEANQAIKAITKKNPKLAYADCAAPMLGEDGKPREELFVKDGLHLSEKGYEVWTGVVREVLGAGVE